MEIVKTESGYVSGTIVGELDQPVSVFRGIPYAAPPVGNLRWKPPQPPEKWAGIRECTDFSSSAPQEDRPGRPKLTLPEDEDCLYLNVFTPAKKASDKLPVMVWAHGGGYKAGSGNDPLFNHFKLPQHGIVLVTINMRLGVFGLFAHPLLDKESPEGVSGNYLFMDLIAALKWVQNNITAFGGNPDNVTIFGQSGGGAKVATLMATPLAKGLFHRAICESGAACPPISPGKLLKDIEKIGKTLFDKLGVNNEKDSLAAARTLPWQKIMEANESITPAVTQPTSTWDAAFDGFFLPDTVTSIFQTGQQNMVPLITCANMGELTGPGLLLIPWVIPAYTGMLSSQRKAGVKAFACIFGQVPASWKREGFVPPHGIELYYLFGNMSDSEWNRRWHYNNPAGAKTKVPKISDGDKNLSTLMMKMWAQFARTGSPGLKGEVDWPEWDQVEDRYLYITETPEVKSGFSKIAQKR